MTPVDMPENLPADPRRRHINLWIETGVVFLVCVAPSTFNSMAGNYFGINLGINHSETPLAAQALGELVYRAGKVALVLFVIARSGEPFARFGIRPFRFGRDLVGGVALWLTIRLVRWLVLVRWVGPVVLPWLHIVPHRIPPDVRPPSTPGEVVLWALASIAIGLEEELIYRAYLITRFEELFESTAIALMLTTAIFSSNHGFQGPVGAISSVTFSLVMGSAFCLFRRFAPLAVAHALYDFIITVTRKS